MTTCKQCGVLFTPNPHYPVPPLFHTRACFLAWTTAQAQRVTCAQCGVVFKAKGHTRTFCSRACYRLVTSQEQGRRLEAAQAARRTYANDRVRSLLAYEFPALTDRELHVFKFAWKEAFRRGYNKAYKRRKGTTDVHHG